ncbi:MAG: hypothetical protein IPP71_10305 [Bacteroidetes bacterium]|nr:hypothetical protein [Bacteroidota bacterium]
MKSTLFSLLIIFVSFCNPSWGQSIKYKKFDFQWPAGTPKVIETSNQFKDEDVVILEEQIDLFIHKEGSGIYYFKKYERLRFNNLNGIKAAAHFILPESLFPQGDRSSINVNEDPLVYRPKGGYECMDYFTARIIKRSGEILPAVFMDSVEIESFNISQKEIKYFAYHFMIKNLEPGDDLEVNYGVREIYDATNALYFHGDFPKQHTTVTISYNNKFSKYYFFEHNGAKSLRQDIDDRLYNEKLTWEFDNLPACINEPGSRPYKELPFVTFYKHDLQYGIWNDSRTIIQSYLPYTWDYVNLFFLQYDNADLADRLSRGDKTTLSVRDFVKATSSVHKDTSQLGKITAVHNEIATNFKYQRDDAYISGEDARLPRIPEFLDKKTLRQISRYDLYKKAIERIGGEYYATFLLDKRVNEIDFDKYEGVVAKDVYFSVIKDNKAYYFQPKFHRFGNFINEFPFYYEDTKCILIPQRVPFEEHSKNIQTIKYAFLNTPFSSIGENVRIINVLTDISLDSLNASFKANIKLSGQFSTMTRGSYLYEYVDTTVTIKYADKIFDHLKGVNHKSIEIVAVDSIYPFKADITAQYKSTKIVEQGSAGQYVINLDYWFKHIYDTKLISKGRDLAYYPDFTSQDRIKYFLKFSSPVEIISPAQPVEMVSDFGAYKFNISQVQPDVIMIESVLVIKQEMVPAKSVLDIEQMFTSIEKSNKSKLVVKKL